MKAKGSEAQRTSFMLCRSPGSDPRLPRSEGLGVLWVVFEMDSDGRGQESARGAFISRMQPQTLALRSSRCPCCRKRLDDWGGVQFLQCGHIFHSECLAGEEIDEHGAVCCPQCKVGDSHLGYLRLRRAAPASPPKLPASAGPRSQVQRSLTSRCRLCRLLVLLGLAVNSWCDAQGDDDASRPSSSWLRI